MSCSNQTMVHIPTGITKGLNIAASALLHSHLLQVLLINTGFSVGLSELLQLSEILLRFFCYWRLCVKEP